MMTATTYSANNSNIINAQVVDKHPELCIEGCIRLAAAVLESACKDYVRALKKIKKIQAIKKPTIQDRNALIQALKEKIECEQFYRSGRFQIFTLGNCRLSPDEVMKGIRLKYGFDE